MPMRILKTGGISWCSASPDRVGHGKCNHTNVTLPIKKVKITKNLKGYNITADNNIDCIDKNIQVFNDILDHSK